LAFVPSINPKRNNVVDAFAMYLVGKIGQETVTAFAGYVFPESHRNLVIMYGKQQIIFAGGKTARIKVSIS
jgi:hypothetical protein